MPDTQAAFPGSQMKQRHRPHPALDFARFDIDGPSYRQNGLARFLRLVTQQPRAALSVAATFLNGKRLRARNHMDALMGRGVCMRSMRWLHSMQKAGSLPDLDWKMEQSYRVVVDASCLIDLASADIERRIALTLAALPRDVPKVVALPPGMTHVPDAMHVRATFELDGLPGALVFLNGGMGDEPCLYLRAGDIPMPGTMKRLYSHLIGERLGVFGDDLILRKRRTPLLVLRMPWDDLQQMTTGHGETAFLFSAQAIRLMAQACKEADGALQLRELLFHLSAARGEMALHHVPFALVRRDGTLMNHSIEEHVVEAVVERRMHAARFLLSARGERGNVRADLATGLVQVRRAPDPDAFPHTTIIIPTRNRLDLLKPCVDSVLSTTRNLPCEVLIVDNGSDDGETLSWLREMKAAERLQVIRDDGPFDFSRLNNVAVRHAKGDMVIFLNNDTEVISRDWVSSLAAHAMRKDTGAVGALLLYPDGKVQHAGVCTSTREGPSHAHQFFPATHSGYLFRLRTPQRFSAVTAACMAVEKRKFLAVGGFREGDLAVALNDVDLCLRLEEKGWRTVWEPAAVLHHKESATRRRDREPDQLTRWQREMAFFRNRWQERVEHDPWYHPGHGQRVADFSIGCI